MRRLAIAAAIACVLADVLVVRQPVVAVIIAALLLVGLLAFAVGVDASVLVIGFLVAAIPKAGLKVGGFPFPFMLFGLVLAASAIVYARQERIAQMPRRVLGALAFLLAWWFERVTVLVLSDASPAELVALTAWFVVPAVLLAVAAVEPAGHEWGVALEAGVVAAATLSLVQVVIGVEPTLIPGLTIAYGDDFASKHVLITTVDYGTFFKIPSSYQNGNTFGVVAGFFAVTALYRILRGDARRWNWILLGSTAMAVALSGSRSVLLAVAVGSSSVLCIRGSASRKLVIVGGALVAAIVAVRLQPGLAERFSLSSITDTQGAGRTQRWREVLDQEGVTGLGLGTSSWLSGPSSEGVFGAAEQVGSVGVVSLLLLAVRSTAVERLRPWRFPLLVVLICFLLDSSYLVFPTLFIPFARMWSPMLPTSSAVPHDRAIDSVAQRTPSSTAPSAVSRRP